MQSIDFSNFQNDIHFCSMCRNNSKFVCYVSCVSFLGIEMAVTSIEKAFCVLVHAITQSHKTCAACIYKRIP